MPAKRFLQEHLLEVAAMSYANVVATAVVAAVILSACATTSIVSGGSKGKATVTACPELEGYPDCQDGHLVDPRVLSPADRAG
jgi:hypothetical protein